MIVATCKIKSCCNRWMKLITDGEHSSAHVTKGRGGEQSVCRAVLVGVSEKGEGYENQLEINCLVSAGTLALPYRVSSTDILPLICSCPLLGDELKQQRHPRPPPDGCFVVCAPPNNSGEGTAFVSQPAQSMG